MIRLFGDNVRKEIPSYSSIETVVLALQCVFQFDSKYELDIFIIQTKTELNSQLNVKSTHSMFCMEISIEIHVCFPFQFVICFINYLPIWNAVHLLALLILLLLLLLPFILLIAIISPHLSIFHVVEREYTRSSIRLAVEDAIFILSETITNENKLTQGHLLCSVSGNKCAKRMCVRACVCASDTHSVWQPFIARTRIKVAFVAYQQCHCHKAFIPRTNSIIQHASQLHTNIRLWAVVPYAIMCDEWFCTAIKWYWACLWDFFMERIVSKFIACTRNDWQSRLWHRNLQFCFGITMNGQKGRKVHPKRIKEN